jgi:hypothetical protein
LELNFTRSNYEWLELHPGYRPTALGTGHEPLVDLILHDMSESTVRRAAREPEGSTTTIFAGIEMADAIGEASSYRRLLAVSVSPELDQGIAVLLLVVLDPDRLQIAGQVCFERVYQTRIDALSGLQFPGSDGTSLTAVELAIDDPTAVPDVMAVLSGLEEDAAAPDWQSQSPEERVVSVESAPPEVVAQYVQSQAWIVLPETWVQIPFLFCTRTELGWNEFCSSSSSGPEQNKLAIPLRISFIPGEPFELHILADVLDAIRQDRATIATINTSTETADLTIVISADAAVTSLEDIAAAVTSGRVSVDIEDNGGEAIPLVQTPVEGSE